MDTLTDLIDVYMAAWNETNPEHRRERIAQAWTEDAVYIDPLMHAEKHDGIDAMLQGVQAQFPEFQFRRTSAIDFHNDRVRFSWELGPESGPAFAGGVDFGVLVGGKLQSITGFLDFAPQA